MFSQNESFEKSMPKDGIDLFFLCIGEILTKSQWIIACLQRIALPPSEIAMHYVMQMILFL